MSLYFFLSSVIISFMIYSLYNFLIWKYNIELINKIVSVMLWLGISFLLVKYIPTSSEYNNSIFEMLLYSFIFIFIYKFISKNEQVLVDKTWIYFSDLVLYVIIINVYILYIWTLLFFNLQFFTNVSIWYILTQTIINWFLLSIIFILSKNSLKFNIITGLSIFLIWLFNIFLFSQTTLNTYFLPWIANTLQLFFWFSLLFYIAFFIYEKYTNIYTILSIIWFVIVLKTIL